MSKLVELNGAKHQHLRVKENSAIELAKTHHILGLKVTELSRAVSEFPIFFTQMNDSKDWTISAITSLEAERNLFVREGQWDAIYTPILLTTYPFFLMQSPKEDGSYTVGIEEGGPAFSTTEGEKVYENEEQGSEMLVAVSKILEKEMPNDAHTYKFTTKLNELGLYREIEVQVHYEDGTVNALKGLNSIDEAKFQALTAVELHELHTLGYIGPIYAALMSMYQLNGLIKRHNLQTGNARVKGVNIEMVKDKNEATAATPTASH